MGRPCSSGRSRIPRASSFVHPIPTRWFRAGAAKGAFWLDEEAECPHSGPGATPQPHARVARVGSPLWSGKALGHLAPTDQTSSSAAWWHDQRIFRIEGCNGPRISTREGSLILRDEAIAFLLRQGCCCRSSYCGSSSPLLCFASYSGRSTPTRRTTLLDHALGLADCSVIDAVSGAGTTPSCRSSDNWSQNAHDSLILPFSR